MKTTLKKAWMLTLCFMMTISCMSAKVFGYEYEATKTITKSFAAHKGSTLSVENKFGNIRIQEWDKNEISFEITVTVTSKKQNDADELLKEITVEFSQPGSTISAVTQIDGKCSFCSQSVNYQIMVPKDIHYRLNQRFGNITMGNAAGNTDVRVQYGNFTAEDLTGTTNLLDVRFGNMQVGLLTGTTNTINAHFVKKATVKQTTHLSVDIRHSDSDLNIGQAGNLKIQSGYAGIKLGTVQKLDLTSRFGNTSIESVNEINAGSGYGNITIKQLAKTLTVSDISHGKLVVENVASGFDAIDVRARYADVKITFAPNVSYTADIKGRYADVNTNSAGKLKLTQHRNETNVKGIVGDQPSPEASVKIVGEHGNITLN
jgi:hypothetical protein